MFAIRDKDRYLHYNGPYWKGGQPLTFDTREAAQAHLEAGNWHLDGSEVVPYTGRTCACMGACDC